MRSHLHSCADCAKLWHTDQLEEITHGIWERCQPGEIMPSGECPECGALCHPTDAPAVIACDFFNAQPRDARLEFTAARAETLEKEAKRNGVPK